MADPVMQLKCYCNSYQWGKKGNESLAARLCAKTPRTDFKIDPEKDYAEMWMGTYPDLPSYVLESGRPLQDVLNENQDLVGKTVLQKFGDATLPFLPKVHPNKELASKLHEQDPEQFTDPNHKPEIAVALSKFEAFCGWKPLKDIQYIFALVPLRRYLPEDTAHFNNKMLKRIVANILNDSDDSIAEAQKQLGALPREDFGEQGYIKDLLPRLQSQYGESIYIPADGIHAYLSGDIIECMARSNNVLNTGFCPRGDRNSIDTFMSTLTYKPHSPSEAMLPAKKSDKSLSGKTVEYAPPMSEFNMLLTSLSGDEIETVKAVAGPSIMITTAGEGIMKVAGKTHELKEGYIFFIGQGVEVTFESRKGLQVYRAYVE